MIVHIIQVTVLFQNPFWVAIFERKDQDGYAVARQIFGSEPTDPELYNFVSTNYYSLRYTEPQKHFKLIIKRPSYKRLLREVRKEMKKPVEHTESQAQEAIRTQLEKNKKSKKLIPKQEREIKAKADFKKKQEKKKKKKKGH